MRELRISIPIIGGVTAIYTQEEVNSAKQHAKTAVRNTGKFLYHGAFMVVAAAMVLAQPVIDKVGESFKHVDDNKEVSDAPTNIF